MFTSTQFERLMMAGFCALALSAAACGNEASRQDKSDNVPEPNRKLPSTIDQSHKTSTKTVPTPKLTDTVGIPNPSSNVDITPEPSFSDLVRKGRALVRKRAYTAAIEQFELALDEKPRSSRALIDAARAYIKLGKAGKARPLAKKAVKLVPNSSYAWNTLGRVELLDHKFDAAAAGFKRAIDVNENNLYAWNNLGLTYIKAKMLDEAVIALKKATSIDNHPKAYMWNNLATAYEQLKNYTEARAAYEKAVSLGSHSARRSLKRLDSDENDTDETPDVTPTLKPKD